MRPTRSISRYLTSSPANLRIPLIAVCVFLATGAQSFAQGVLWGLFYKNSFSVSSNVEKTTTVTIGDGQPTLTKSTEMMVVRYEVLGLAADRVTLRATVEDYDRLAGSDSTPALGSKKPAGMKGLEVELHVSMDGNVTQASLSPDSIRSLTQGDVSAEFILGTTCTQAMYQSWFGRPFWMSVPDEEFAADTTWQRMEEIGVGFLGQLRNLVTCRIESVDENTAQVSLKGKSRHVIRAADGRRSRSSVLFENGKVQMSECTGKGVMIRPNPDDLDPVFKRPVLRPWFESLEMTWKISGSTRLKVGSSDGQQVTFEQTRKVRSQLLPDYRIGDQLILPLPADFQLPR